jgi:hypothetical protein
MNRNLGLCPTKLSKRPLAQLGSAHPRWAFSKCLGEGAGEVGGVFEADFEGYFNQGGFSLDEQLLGAFHPHPSVDEGGGAFGFPHKQALELSSGEPDRCGEFLDRQASLDMLLHHDQHGPDPWILALDGERLAGLDGKRGSRLFNVESG